MDNKNYRLDPEENISFSLYNVSCLSPFPNPNLDNIWYHSSTNGPWTKEAFIFNDTCFHVIKMKNTVLGLFKMEQFEIESLSVRFNMKIRQNAELHYCSRRFVYTKSSIFGYLSSLEAFNSSNTKSVLTFYSRMFFKSSVWQSIVCRVPTLVNGSHPLLRMDNSIGSNHPSGCPKGLKLKAAEDCYNKPFYNIERRL
jgi:hypothetical protein